MRNIAIIFLFALTLRLSYIAVMHPEPYVGDSVSWERPAIDILSGRGYGEARRAPVYPLMLTLIYCLFGHSSAAVQIIQSIIGALTCVIVCLIGRKLFSGTAGVISAVLAGFYPYLVYYTGVVFSETLYAFMISVSVFTLLAVHGTDKNWKWMVAGALAGLTALCKPVFLIFFPFVLIWLLLTEENKTRAFKRCLFLLLGIAAAILPWTARNYSFYRGFLLISTGAHDLWLTNNDSAVQLETLPEMDSSMSQKWTWYPKERFEEISKLPALEAERVFAKEAVQWIRKNPGTYSWLLWRRFIHFWRFWPKMADKKEKIIAMFTSGIFLPLGFAGMALALKQCSKGALLLILLFISLTIGHLPFATMIRYRVPMDPLILVFTGYTLSLILKKFNYPPHPHLLPCPMSSGGPSGRRDS